jgi:tellurite resistance protein TerC
MTMTWSADETFGSVVRADVEVWEVTRRVLAPHIASESGSNGDNFASFDVAPWIWMLFLVLLAGVVAVDLRIHRHPVAPTTKRAATELALWIGLGLLVACGILAWQGGRAAGEYLAGYAIETSLSLDNVFLWYILMSGLGTPRVYQYRVLTWAIVGAIVLRIISIFVGAALIQTFSWLLLVFGALLVFTAVGVILGLGDELVAEDANNDIALRAWHRIAPRTTEFNGPRLFVRHGRKLLATPAISAALVLARTSFRRSAAKSLVTLGGVAAIIAETSDFALAVESVPAILSVSREQFLILASSVLALLGFRSLYFLMGELRHRFRYLEPALTAILVLIGLKLMLTPWYDISLFATLGCIVGLIAVALAASVWRDPAPSDDDKLFRTDTGSVPDART